MSEEKKSKQDINEEMHLETEWFKEARKQTPDTLMDYINHVMKDYSHDYGTVCHAIAACAIAAAWAANEIDGAYGGISNFQAGFVMWDFIREWMYSGNKCGLKIINYDDMLYPQYGFKFAETISASTWDNIQKAAKNYLNEKDGYVHPDVLEHWKDIAAGIVPFGYRVAQD